MDFTIKIFKYIIKKKILIVCAFSVFLIFLNTNLGSDWKTGLVRNISYHDMDNNNVIPEFGEEYKPQPRSIFFHETSCEGNLTSRQACAVESAARAHPDWDIHVLFSSPLSKYALDQGSLRELHAMRNVKLMQVNIKDYAVGTPLEQFIVEGALNRSRWRVEHTSDVLRYLTLYKWGGVYMDLDIVVARSVASLARNWVARESDQLIASAVLAFSRDSIGRCVADAAVREISTNFRGDAWSHNGPGVVTRVLKGICSTRNSTAMSSATCKGFEVYGPELFFPLYYDRGMEYFTSGNLSVGNVYTYHLWNYITKKYKMKKDSPYAKLAKKLCPTVFKLYGDDFGN